MAVFRFESWQDLPGVIHGVSTAEFGNLSYKWAEANHQTPEQIAEGRQEFFAACGAKPQNVVATQVIDGTDLIDVTERDHGRGITDPESGLVGDGFFTNKLDTYLFVITGDCLVLFLLEPEKRVCGLVHAGYKGVDKELPRLAVEHMVRHYGCQPDKIRVGFSPALQQTVLEHLDKFDQERLNRWQPYLSGSAGHYLVNWVGFATNQLIAAGIRPDQMENLGLDTFTNPNFFSHFRSKTEKNPEARFGCLIGFNN